MRLVLFGLAILLAATLATLFAVEDPGYVLIARAPWTVEMSLTLFVPLLFVAFLALNFLLYLVWRLWRIPRDVARWRTRRAQREGRAALLQGLTHVAAGNWVEAEAALLASQRHSDSPLLSSLGAAIAAQAQSHLDKRDEYLAAAHRHAPAEGLAIGMVQAYLQHLAHQREQSLASLAQLHQELPRHKFILRLLAHMYGELRDWPGLIELLPEVRRQGALEPAELDALELRAHRELLTLSLPSGSLDVLARAWNAVPKHLRREPSLVALHARQLMQQHDMAAAESELRTALETAWEGALVDLYGELHGPAVAEYLDTAEGWLAARPDDAKLLLALGRLAARAGQAPKARQYLEQSIARQPSMVASFELGRLLEQFGEKDAALAALRRGLESCVEAARPPSRPRGFGGSRATAS